MDWKDVANAVANIAPVAGTVIGGPVGMGVGTAIKALAGVFGITSPDPKPEEVMKAIQGDPQAALKLQMAVIQYAHEEKMAEIEDRDKGRDDSIKELREYFKSTENAQKRQIEHEKATGKSDVNLYFIAWMFIGGFFAVFIIMTVLIFLGKFPKDVSPAAIYLLGIMTGALNAGVAAIIQFFFGKTKDSTSHVQMLANSVSLEEVNKLLESKK